MVLTKWSAASGDENGLTKQQMFLTRKDRFQLYLRSTTGDSTLNHLMMLHVHKDRTGAINLVDVANDFVGEKENRKQLFGKFFANDILNKFSISSKSTQTEN